MILDILRNLSLSKIELLMRILDGCILFFFISIFFTSIIINIKNRNLKSMLISFIFIIIFIYNDDTAGLKFAQDAEGNWGYIPSGADTVIPFKTGDIKLDIISKKLLSCLT